MEVVSIIASVIAIVISVLGYLLSKRKYDLEKDKHRRQIMPRFSLNEDVPVDIVSGQKDHETSSSLVVMDNPMRFKTIEKMHDFTFQDTKPDLNPGDVVYFSYAWFMRFSIEDNTHLFRIFYFDADDNEYYQDFFFGHKTIGPYLSNPQLVRKQ